MAQETSARFTKALADTAAATDRLLDRLLPEAPGNRLRGAMRYAVLGQGKRLRPFLVTQTAGLFRVDSEQALLVGAAVECVHCYSLVHDDLPAMDNDDIRRGQPTTHRKFGEATAILAGDALLTFAFEILAKTGFAASVRSDLVLELARAAGESGMVGGQMLDIEAESTSLPSLSAIAAMQLRKTGALFRFACESGSMMAEADGTQLCLYADHIGLAFQIADDILDVESSPETLGKATGKDIKLGKATFVDFLGLARAKQEADRHVEAAIAALKVFGTEADLLRETANFVVSRQR